MAEEHTFNNFKKEWWLPQMYNRERHAIWTANGSKTFGDAAKERLMGIINDYTVEELPRATTDKFQKIINDLK